MKNRSSLTLFIIIFIMKLVSAQDITGNLEGRIVDTSEIPISGVNILIRSESLQGTKGTSTNDKGQFSFLSVPIGNYKLKISAVGYRELIVDNILISLGRTTSLGRITMQQKTIDLPEVIISGEKQIIDPASTVYGGNLRPKEFDRLPIDRNYKSIATLLPQVNSSFYGDGINIAGTTGSENKYFIDGVDVTDMNYGITGTNLPYNFVKEVQLLTGGYEAEYRSALGGLINVVTLSGSNELHGSVFGFYTSNGLTAPKRIGLLDPTQGGFSNYDFGFSLSGPILIDKLWFNVAYNSIFNLRDVDVPSFGIYEDKIVTHSFAAKLMWKASNKLNLTLSSTGDPYFRNAVGFVPALSGGNPVALENIDPYLTEWEGGGFNYSLIGSYLFNNNIMLEAMVSRINRIQELVPSTELGKNEIVQINTQTGTWSGGSFGSISVPRSGTTAETKLNIQLDSHLLKFGVAYRDNKVDAELQFPDALFRFNDSAYVLVLNGTEGIIHTRIKSAFLQDSWQITNKLRMNAGLRWDGQDIVGGDGQVAQQVVGLFQPRIGFIFLLDDDGTQKISGSFGRFNEEWHTGVMMSAYTGKGYFYEIHFNQDPRNGAIPGDTVINTPAVIMPEEPDLKAQYYDEITLGYEQSISTDIKISLLGVYRTLQEAITAGVVQGVFKIGNPGKGVLSDFPEAKRDYQALVVAIEKSGGDNFNFLASYTLSRNYGNYEGLYDYYNQNIVPNINFTFAEASFLKNATGLLPSDRTHVFKFSGSYRFNFGLIFGTTITWQTGTPLSEIASFGSFIEPRGTSGRTPSIWDINARLIYPVSFYGKFQTRFILDILHIASTREPVDIDQQLYFNVDRNGNPVNLNPNYGIPQRYQPPMSFRLGMEINF